MRAKRTAIGGLVILLAAGAGAVAVEAVKYGAGRESWLFSGWSSSGWRPDVSASLDAGGRILVVDPGTTWRDVTITLYTGSVPWTHSLGRLANEEQRISLVQFADPDGNRFKPAEKRPQRFRITGVVDVPVEQPDGGMIGRPRKLTIERKLTN